MLNMTTTPNTPKRSSLRTGLAGVAVTTAALVGGMTVLPALAGAQEVEPETPETETETESTEQSEGRHRRGHKGFGSSVLSDLLGLSQEELREQFAAGNTAAEIAAVQGVELDTVVTALTDEVEAKIAERVEAGNITQEEADEKLAGLEEKITERLNTVPTGRRGHGHGRARGSEVVQELLGLTQEEIREGFQAGQTLADLAEANGVSTDALVDAIVADAEAKVAEKLEAGDITQERADSVLEGLEEKVEDKVTSERPARGGVRGARGPRTAAPATVDA